MRIRVGALLLGAVLLTVGCASGPPEVSVEERDRQHRADTDEAARKAGRVAHKAATETEELARKAGRELKEAAKSMREGWKEAGQEERAKPKH